MPSTGDFWKRFLCLGLTDDSNLDSLDTVVMPFDERTPAPVEHVRPATAPSQLSSQSISKKVSAGGSNVADFDIAGNYDSGLSHPAMGPDALPTEMAYNVKSKPTFGHLPRSATMAKGNNYVRGHGPRPASAALKSRPGSARPGSARPGSARPGSARPGSAKPSKLGDVALYGTPSQRAGSLPPLSPGKPRGPKYRRNDIIHRQSGTDSLRAQSMRQGSARPGSARPGSARPGIARPGSARMGRKPSLA